jgi:rSAM/selenodomain-associated transferase 2
MAISVIIPTLNEQRFIAEAVRSARRLNPREIIVVDGGSEDGTVAAGGGADRILEGPRGRARQMNLAAAAASGNTLLFLHADCTLEDGALREVERRLRRPGVVAGCFRLTVPSTGLLYRLIDWFATARVRLTGIAYGDQGLFVRKDAFERCGGFPELRFMEDLFLCRKLRRQGRIIVARSRIYPSPRRWQRMGVIRQTLSNWTLTVLALAGVSPDRLARFYPAVR